MWGFGLRACVRRYLFPCFYVGVDIGAASDARQQAAVLAYTYLNVVHASKFVFRAVFFYVRSQSTLKILISTIIFQR